MTVDDIEPTPDEIERWTKNLTRPPKSETTISETERRIAEKLLGTKTAAEHWISHNAIKPLPGKTRLGNEKPYRAPEVRVHFEYFDYAGDHIRPRGWTIERYENGRRVSTESGIDLTERDNRLIRYQGSGFTCKPVEVAGVKPAAIQGRLKLKSKPSSQKKSILAQIGKLTVDDLGDFDE